MALPHNEKLKKVTTWLKGLRQSVEALNQCIDNCEVENTARGQIMDVFDPMLSFLTSLIRAQRTYVQGKRILDLAELSASTSH